MDIRIIAKQRLAKRLTVKAVVDGHEGEYSFASPDKRDDFIRRIVANGGTAEIMGSPPQKHGQTRKE